MKSNSVVLLGDLNPAIFSPEWVRKYLDITVDDGEEAEVKIIHSEIADFMLSDIRFTIERNRLIINTLAHDSELIGALAVQMFSVLSHTPIWAYGVNFERHVDFGSFESRNKLGRLLCPLDHWGAWAEGFDNKDPQLNGGMANVTMKKIHSVDPEVFELFTIQPSQQPDFVDSGVFFSHNNHYGKPAENGKNNEKFRDELLTSLRENIVPFSRSFDKLVKHFETLGGVND